MTNTIIITMLVATLMSNNATTHTTYMRGMAIIQIDYTQDIVTCVDAVGYEWEFYGCEDYAVNDLLCVMLDNNGTKDTILDDIIVETAYSGYWME